MKCVVYLQVDGSVAIDSPSNSFMAAVTGSGGLIRTESVEREVAKRLLETPDDAAAFKVSWEDFLTPKIGTPAEVKARKWANTICYGGLSEEEALELIAVNTSLDIVSHRIIEHSTLPDRYFREAWEDTGTTVQVNMPKARSVHLDQVRKARDAALVELDLPFVRAVEAGDTNAQATIATKKQTLRDIPQTFDLTARTPEQLKAKWPPELPSRTA